MKKLLVIPIIGAYYLLMAVLFPIKLLLICISHVAEFVEDLSNKVSIYHEDYLMEPAERIYRYALRIMQSDKIMKRMQEVSNRLKMGKPIE